MFIFNNKKIFPNLICGIIIIYSYELYWFTTIMNMLKNQNQVFEIKLFIIGAVSLQLKKYDAASY